MEIEEKENEIRKLKLKVREGEDDLSVQVRSPEVDNYKINSLKMDLQMMESQYQQAETDKNRYYNKTIEL